MTKMLTSFLYRLGGTVPEYIERCPASERQRYRNLAYAMFVVWLLTAFAAHHAATLWGFSSLLAWIPAFIWASTMVLCDRIVVIALVKREGRKIPWLSVAMRLLLVLVNAAVLGFFAVLASNQDALARVRFEQKQRAVIQDRTTFVAAYQIKEQSAIVTDMSAQLADLKKKLATTPSHIEKLRTDANVCRQQLESFRYTNAKRRRDLMGTLAAMNRSTVDPGEADSIRVQIEEMDSKERLHERRCAKLSASLTEETNRYYTPLREEKLAIEHDLARKKATLSDSEGQVRTWMDESKRVSDAAFSFNVAAQGRALTEYLAQTWLAPVIVVIIWIASISLETIPIGIKAASRGGTYDAIVFREESSFESRLSYEAAIEAIRREAELEKIRNATPYAVRIFEPLTLFMITEAEIAKARRVRESAAKEDPSRVEELDRTFEAAVAKTRAELRKFSQGIESPAAISRA